MEVKHIVSRMENGQIAVPRFQRGYVWDRAKTAALMDSLYRGYPIGIVTYWEQTDNAGKPTRLIVDGQQRLSTLYACYTDQVPQAYDKAERAPIKGLHFDPTKQQFKFPRRQDLRGNHAWIKVSDVLQDDNEAAMDEWQQRVEAAGTLSAERRQYERRIQRLRTIRDREIKEEDLDTTCDEKDVLEIFERINTKGRRLEKGDLEMAWLSVLWPEIRDRVNDEAAKWQDTPFAKVMNQDSLVRCLTAVHTGRYQPGSLRESKPSANDIRQSFEKVVECNAVIATCLQSRLGVTDPKAVSTAATFTILTRYLSNHGNRFPTAKDEANALAYHLTASGWGVYHGSTASQIDADVRAVDTSEPWEALLNNARANHGEMKADPVRFEITRRSRGRFYCVVEMLRMQGKAIDWSDGRPIREHEPSELQQHHIFPRVVLQTRGTAVDDLENIANIALISKTANLQIADTPPSVYLPKLQMTNPDILRGHCIPRNLDLWEVENFEDFLQQRRELMGATTDSIINDLRTGKFP